MKCGLGQANAKSFSGLNTCKVMEKNQTSVKTDANITHSGQPTYPSLRISTGIRPDFVLKTIKNTLF